MGEWDLYLKKVVWESPQDFVSLLFNGARYVGHREGQFQTREIRSDGMIEAEYEGQPLLLHIEFQARKDDKIGERLLGYSYEATRLHNLPVFSCVIYVKHVFEPPQPPYTWQVPGRGAILAFEYGSLQLADIPVEQLEQKHLVGTLPLLLLARGGATRAVMDRALSQLQAAGKREALTFLQWIAGNVFEQEEDLKWLEWRIEQMQEFFESSWTYQRMAQQKLQQGLEQGREQGLEQGREEGLRQGIETAVQARFPALVELARERIAQIQDHEALQQVLVAMITATTEASAQHYLLALTGSH